MSFPNLPGIPPLRNPGPAGIATLAAPVISKLLNSLAPKWGIYKKKGQGMTPAITPDSFIGIDYTNGANVANYPIEEGAYASYNKVQNPRAWSVMVAKGGSKTDLQGFINDLESLQASLELYTILTPNKLYSNANIDKVEFRRETKNGAGMILAAIHFVEIRQAQASFSKAGSASPTATASPTSQAQVNDGLQQAGPLGTATPDPYGLLKI